MKCTTLSFLVGNNFAAATATPRGKEVILTTTTKNEENSIASNANDQHTP